MAAANNNGAVDQQRDLWGSIFAWIKEDQTLAEWLTVEEEAIVLNNDPDILELWSLFTQYQGFDIKRILLNMRRSFTTYVAEVATQDTSVTFTVNGEDGVFRYTNKESMARDVSFLCFLFSTRGSTWEKFQAKSVPQLSLVTGWLKAKYQIDDTVNDANSSLDPDVVTIPRIAACFPIKMCEYMGLGYGKKLCTLEQMGLGGINGISNAVLSPFYNCTIPHSWCRIGQAPHIYFFIVHVYVDNTIHRKQRDYTDLDTMFTYYSAAFRTPGVPQMSRIKYSAMTGIANIASNGFRPELAQNLVAANNILRGLRRDDPQLEVVITSLMDLVG